MKDDPDSMLSEARRRLELARKSAIASAIMPGVTAEQLAREAEILRKAAAAAAAEREGATR